MKLFFLNRFGAYTRDLDKSKFESLLLSVIMGSILIFRGHICEMFVKPTP